MLITICVDQLNKYGFGTKNCHLTEYFSVS